MSSPCVSFDILPLTRYQGNNVKIKRPRELTYFSYNIDRQCLPQSELSLKYYCPVLFGAPGEVDRQFPIQLSDGFSTFRKHDDTIDEHLDALLQTLLEHERSTPARHEAQIVTWRGIMTKILTAPYERFDGFALNAVLHQSTIYIEEHHLSKKTDNSRQRNQSHQPRYSSATPSMDEMQYWGYKFESLCTLSKRHVDATRPEIESRNTMPVNNIEQYCSIVQTSIGGTDLILAGEVDCVLGEKPGDPEQVIPWIELKTSKLPSNERDEISFARKLIKYWAQSYLLGVGKIVVGFRDGAGELQKIKQYETHQLQAVAKDLAQRRGQESWNGSICVNFAAAFLDFLKAHVNEPGVVYRISRTAKTDHITVTLVDDASPETIVPHWYKAHREHSS